MRDKILYHYCDNKALESIIKNKQARDADRLKAIEMYTEMYDSGDIEGITFINDLYRGKEKKGEKTDE